MMTETKMFGTNGIRGEVGKDLTPQMILDLGRAIGTVSMKLGGRGAGVIVGRDTRYSGDMLLNSLSAGLLSTGCSVTDGGILPTPALQYSVKNSDAVMGVMLTASHNPPEYNGLKTVSSDGTETSQAEEMEIERTYHSREFSVTPWTEMGILSKRTDFKRMYVEGVLKNVNLDRIRKSGLAVVLDCANGATFETSPSIMKYLGVRNVTLNAQADGGFPGHQSEPTEAHLGDLITIVAETGADLGIAHDGDGDRTIFVDESGGYIFGDKSLALVAKHIVEKKGGGRVVTPINTSSVLQDVVEEAGGEVVYTPIGSPIVARKMMEVNAVFGGEENGGLIFPSHQHCRDGGMASAALLDILAEREEPMSKLLEELPVYHLCKLKMSYPAHHRNTILKRYLDAVADKNPMTMDGIKVQDETGWVLVRPSGTETIYRIQVEDSDPARARKKANDAKKLLEDILAELE
ncbi:MAG: phosphoglucosamine mutase [Candidatus Thermoplasmatota archaeon]|nr:phosphoglucosamine mutase [Candidatus Thermoplasmatota archaeon]